MLVAHLHSGVSESSTCMCSSRSWVALFRARTSKTRVTHEDQPEVSQKDWVTTKPPRQKHKQNHEFVEIWIDVGGVTT